MLTIVICFLLLLFLGKLLVQDGNLRKQNKWRYTKYDKLNRPVVEGIYTAPNTKPDQMQGSLNAYYDHATGSSYYEVFDMQDINSFALKTGYTVDRTFPPIDADYVLYSPHPDALQNITYYDDYNFKSILDNPSQYGYYDMFNINRAKAKGLVTGTRTKVLGTDIWLATVNYYDKKDRVIQSISDNILSGYDVISNKYNFAGDVLETVTSHTIERSTNNMETKNVIREYKYDHAGRLNNVTLKNDLTGTFEEVKLSEMEYDELGQLRQKKLHQSEITGKFLQTVDYDYNIRGWLTAINDASLSDGEDLFGMELLYNEGFEEMTAYAKPQYNGNISGMKWNAKHFEAKRGYGFKYDGLNRLKKAVYGVSQADAWDYQKNRYTVDIGQYDRNGNIMQLERKGYYDDNDVIADDLSYTYNGNQLTQVADAGEQDYGFIDNKGYNPVGDEYIYDRNGNMTEDFNKNISVSYNILNLPDTITFYDEQNDELGKISDLGIFKQI